MNLEYRYGLLCGAALSLWVLIEFALGFHTTHLEIGQYSGYFSFVVPLILIFTGLRDYQNKRTGVVSLKEGINIGFTIAIVSSMIFTIFLYAYNTFINPEWIETMAESQRKKLILGGASDDAIEQFMDQHRKTNNAFGQMIMSFVSTTGIGVFVTLIEIPVIKLFFTKK